MGKVCVRVCKIQVEKLFGSFDYDIDFPAIYPIAIITAPNGCGKTTILNMLSFILTPTFKTFNMINTIPFNVFRCTLSNGKIVELKKIPKPAKDHAGKGNRPMRLAKDLFKTADFELTIYNNQHTTLGKMIYSEALNDASEMFSSEYIGENDDDFSFTRRHPPTGLLFHNLCKIQCQLLEENGCNIPVKFIKADRIQPVMVPPKNLREYDRPHPESPLKIASERISQLIKESTDKYNEAVSQAKDKLPQMFLDGEGSGLNCEEFMDGWSVYRKELNQFQEIGLITPTEDFTLDKDISNVYEDKGKFLSTYLSAFKDTTSSLKDIYGRLNLFKQTLDERNVITGKKIVFGRNGISIFFNDREINLDTLSSGEKHDFIMFYNLIFGIKENGLVLVDEPEISLHIEWQETYLDKLLAICEMNGLQAIVATHSPNIVSSHYDFLVDKGEADG